MATKKRFIDAYALERRIVEMCKEPNYQHIWEDWRNGLCMAMEAVNEMPTVDAVEVVHGRWEDCSDKDEIGMNLRCVVCGGRADSFVGGTEDWYCLWKPNFCPHCGAKMDGDGNG